MKRKLLSALLFGAVLAASTSTFVSCKDYDDDISDLRSQITTNATTLKDLVTEKTNNVETEISALKSAQTKLTAAYEAADDSLGTVIKNATNDANGYADIQSAQAKAAAIKAAQELVDNASKELQASLDDANDSIDALGNTVDGLLAADKELTKGISAAQARADQAYTLAAEAKGAASDVASDLKTINETLTKQISLLATSLKTTDSLANKNKADIEKQTIALNYLAEKDSIALKALSDKDTELNKLISANASEISKLWTAVGEAKDAASQALTDAKAYTDQEVGKVKTALGDSIKNVNVSISKVKEGYAAADVELQKQITALDGRVATNETNIGKIQTAIGKINALLAQLISGNVNNLITSIIYQGSLDYANVYAKVVDNSKFPYATFAGAESLPVGKFNIQSYAGELYATVNPSSVDASKAAITMENSLGEAGPYTVGKAVSADGKGVKLTRATSKNGLWILPLEMTNTISESDPSTDDALYALTTTYTQDTVNAEGETATLTKKVYSHYAVEANYALATKATNVSIVGIGASSQDPITFSELEGYLELSTGDIRVYKEFIECTSVKNSTGTEVNGGVAAFNKANEGIFSKITDGIEDGSEDTAPVTCPETFKNYKITVKYYIQNYDGSIVSTSKVLVFNKSLWDAETTKMSGVPTAATTSTASSSEFPTFSFVKGDKCSNGTTWSEEAYSATVTSDNAELAGATVSLRTSAGVVVNDVTVGGGATNLTVASLGTVKNMVLVYDPSKLTVGTTYKATVTFRDKNGYITNVVYIEFTMAIPTGKPNPWHIAAAFDSADKLTIAWAGTDAAANTVGTIGSYSFSGSFYKVDNGYSASEPYMFKLNGTTAYTPNQMPQMANTYVMNVPNKAVQDENVYSMIAGVKFFGLDNLISYNAKAGWADTFNIKFLSPIKYAILGTKDYIDGKVYTGMSAKTINVDYRKSVTVNNSYFTAIDPKEATTTYVKFFENKDSRVVSTSLDFAEVNSNNALFSDIVTNADGTYTLVTSDKVSMTGDTKVKFRLTVKDCWGISTGYDFYVTVKANQ